MTKSHDPIAQLASQLTEIAKGIEATTAAIGKRQDDLQKRLDSLTTDSSGQIVRKAEPASRQSPEVDRLLRRRDRLNQRLANVWERPDLHDADAERNISKSLQAVEDELHAHGHEAERATLDSGSAFLHRGGRSDFLVASPMTLDEVLGVQRSISKSDEDEINVTNNLVL